MAKVKKEKAPKPKKEKKPKVKKEKPVKPKKEKAPKPKKEKKPKVKKEKPVKPKKEKAPKAKTKAAKAGAEGEEEEGKGGKKKKLLLILLPVIVVAAAAVVFLLLNPFGGGSDEDPDAVPAGTEAVGDSESGEQDGDGDGEADGEPGESDGDGEADAEPEPEPEPDNGEIQTGMTTAEVVSYFENLSPAQLGLAGEDMSQYEAYATDSIVLIDGRVCTQVRVYGESSVGTNEVQGIFFLSRDAQRVLYRYDEDEDAVYEMSVGSARYDSSTGSVTITEEPEGAGAEAEAGD